MAQTTVGCLIWTSQETGQDRAWSQIATIGNRILWAFDLCKSR